MRAEDPPKDKDKAEKKEPEAKKDQTPKERYDALVKEYRAKQQELVNAFQKAKGEEQQKLIKEYQALGGDYADKFAKLAEDDPKSTVGTDAAFWILQNAPDAAAAKKAAEKVKAFVADTPLTD